MKLPAISSHLIVQAACIIVPNALDYAVYRFFAKTLLPKERNKISTTIGGIASLFGAWGISRSYGWKVGLIAPLAHIIYYNIYYNAVMWWTSRCSRLSPLSGQEALESVQARDTLIFWGVLSRQIGLPINLSKTVTFTQAAEKAKEFPQWIQAHKKLIQRITLLGLNQSNLTTLPKEIGILENLSSLSLFNNELSSLPEELGQLKKLKSLNLTMNKFTKFPSIICELTMLNNLMLAGNPLEWIPKKIKLLQELKCLYLSHCNLYELPSIAELKKLEYLWIFSNNLLTLPSDFPPSLTHIDASRNRIPDRIVQRFQNLPNLTIDFSHQQLEEEPNLV